MSIRRIFITIAAVMSVSAVFADSASVTSKKYVDDFMTGYQDKVSGLGANKLMIYDNSDDGIGTKDIATSLGSNTSADSVPTVGAVKTGLDGKQDTITGTAGYVMTGTSTAGTVGERAIYGADTNYSDALVTAETVNTGVINAVNSSLIRVGTDGQPNENGTLWEINTDLFALNTNGTLPNEYTQLEWIESTGTQYIDTGHGMNATTEQDNGEFRFSLDIQFTNTDARTIFGYATNSGTYFSIAAGATKYSNTTGTYSVLDRHTFNANTVVDVNSVPVISNTTSVVINGQTVGTGGDSRATTASAGNLRIMSPPYIGSAKIYGLKQWQRGVLVFNGIPAKNSSNVGMYDTVSGTFFPDAAGGNFIAGPAVAGN